MVNRFNKKIFDFHYWRDNGRLRVNIETFILFFCCLFFSIFRTALAANHLMGYMRIHIHLLLPSYSPPDKFLPFRKSKFSDEIRLAAADFPLHVPRWHLNNWAYRIIIKTPLFFFKYLFIWRAPYVYTVWQWSFIDKHHEHVSSIQRYSQFTSHLWSCISIHPSTSQTDMSAVVCGFH